MKNSNKLQPSIDEEEYVKLLNCNHELERRVYVLENANYSLSEELTKRTRIASGKGYPSITDRNSKRTKTGDQELQGESRLF